MNRSTFFYLSLLCLITLFPWCVRGAKEIAWDASRCLDDVSEFDHGLDCGYGRCKSPYVRNLCYGAIFTQFGCFEEIKGCRIYNCDNTCYQCEMPATEFKGLCYSCDISNCTLCQKDNECSVCSYGFPNKAKSKCFACSIPNCVSCSNHEVCELCIDKYAVYDNQCIQCDVKDCASCSRQDHCVKCKEGYSLATETRTCVPSIAHCTDPNGNGIGCRVCDKDYKISGAACTRCTMSNCLECAVDNQCSKCDNSLVPNVDGSLCVVKMANCVAQKDNNTCVTCDVGMAPSPRGICIECKIDQCTLCGSVNVCNSCNATYQLVDGSCLPVCNKENCYQCANHTACGTCAGGYGLTGVSCTRCEEATCKICDVNVSSCTKYFTEEELNGGKSKKSVPWWAWLLVGIGAALLLGFIIFLIVWCCRDPVALYTEYEDNFTDDNRSKSRGSSRRSFTYTSSSRSFR